MKKIALGTAQFGLDYGINNRRGKIPPQEAREIFALALNSGVDTLDTAAAYGESEQVIGQYLRDSAQRFKVVSKLPKCATAAVGGIVADSLKKLHINFFDGYLFHNFQNYEQEPELLDALKELKRSGQIKKLGFSLYYPAELETILNRGLECDIVQFPYSVLDQRFAPFLPLLKAKGVEVHVRSIFLQGLLFKQPAELAGIFSPIRDKLIGLRSLAERSGLSLAALLVDFALANEDIDRVVIGVDGIDNLQEIVASAGESRKSKRVMDDLRTFKEDNEDIILPFNWKVAAVR
jgi:aryl-alcohol dehydrogenase-like predicted oxidoreductase